MFCEKTLETKAHSGQTQCDDTRNVTIRANVNDDSQFPVSPANNKIVNERIWINPVTSKIVKQPLEADNDAQLHIERVITMREAAEFASRVLHKKCPR